MNAFVCCEGDLMQACERDGLGRINGAPSVLMLCETASMDTRPLTVMVGLRASRLGAQSGAALLGVLVLGALALVSVLALTAASIRSVKEAVASSTKVRTALALDIAVSDVLTGLKEEIAAGSRPALAEDKTDNETIFYPVSSWSMVPYRTPGLPPNLVRQSKCGIPFYDSAVRSNGALVYPKAISPNRQRIASDASTTVPALNARGVNASRWNLPRLITVHAGSSANSDAPCEAGVQRENGSDVPWTWTAPDWMLMRADGSLASKWDPSLRKKADGFESDSAGGIRFAFQIYETGGLLDLNAAGYDPERVNPIEASRKGGLCFAELSEVGFDTAMIRALNFWRLPRLSSNRAGPPYGNSYVNFLLAPMAAAARAAFDPLANGIGGCRGFVSRAQLLRFVRSCSVGDEAGRSTLGALEFLTHFSRALEQPSVAPGCWDEREGRRMVPRIVGPAGAMPDQLYPINVAANLSPKDLRVLLNLPYEMALGNYRGGNDAWGTFADRGKSSQRSLQEVVNPAVLEIRVCLPFLRRDGSTALVGEPLIKARFPLSRLAWITWKGPSAALGTDDPLYDGGGTPEAIRECFGLEWSKDAGIAYLQTDAMGPPADQVGYGFWKYDHSVKGGHVLPESIGRLEDVALDGREPDFFELLKAGILVGSLGKAAAKNHSGMEGWAHDPASYYQVRDKDPTTQILEIGANLIDQYDTDSFPTIIKMGTTNALAPGGPAFAPTFTARGIENLPYIYRLHWRAIENSVDPPRPPAAAIREVTSELSSFAGEGFHCGTTSLIAFPELWNPHLPPARATDRTMKMRIVAVAEDPEGLSGPSGQLRPLFPILGSRWKALMFSGAPEDRHAHFAAWPGGAFAFSIGTEGKSTKTFFHDRRFSTSYEFYGTSSEANDDHSCRLSTNAPAEPSSYLFWQNAPAGGADWKHAIEGYAFWKLPKDGFAPLDAPCNSTVPEEYRGATYSLNASISGVGERQVWFAPVDGRVVGCRLLEGPPPLKFTDPRSPVVELRNSELVFQLPSSRVLLFREPTALCRRGLPEGSDFDFGVANFFKSAPYHGVLSGSDGSDWVGFSLGEVPAQFLAAQRMVGAEKTTVQGVPERVDSTGALAKGGSAWRFFQVPVNLALQRNWSLMTVRLQYQEPLGGKWVTYDERYLGMDGRMEPDVPPYQGQWNAVPVEGKGRNFEWAYPAIGFPDPRTARFGGFQQYAYNWRNALIAQNGVPPKTLTIPLGPSGNGVTDRSGAEGTQSATVALGGGPAQINLSWVRFKAAIDQDPSVVNALYQKASVWWAVRSLIAPPSMNANDYGWISRIGNPAYVAAPACAGARGFSHFWEDYSHDGGVQESTESGRWSYWADSFRPGWLSENIAPDSVSPERQAYADPDDIVRRASGAYGPRGGYDDRLNGLPLAQKYPARSRPVILDRPFRSVAEMSYAFRGAPWKHVDFATPESADAALLDIFCLSELPAKAPLASGKVNLNTRREPVLRALIAGALKDEADETQFFPAGGLARTNPEVVAAARAVLDRTSGSGLGRGPFENMGDLVGKVVGRNLPVPSVSAPPNSYGSMLTLSEPKCGGQYISVAPSTVTAPNRNLDATSGQSVWWTFSGLSADLDSVFESSADRKIPRLRESVVRALADAGQVRVWNLMIDVIAQVGRYPPTARDASEFLVEGEARAWVHLAIDRLTGRIIDLQREPVEE